MKREQRGVALISVLLVLTLALLLTESMLRSHRLAIASSAQHIHQFQLRQLARTGEAWARQRLQEPESSEPPVTALGQPWAQSSEPFRIEGGQIRVKVEDLAGRFNLTRLFKNGQADQVTLKRWERLLVLLEIPHFDVSPAMADGLVDVSQLRLLAGVDAQVIRQLRPRVALLPQGAGLNVNTASAMLLATLENLPPAAADQLVSQRPPEGFASPQAFAQAPALSGLGVSSHGLGVNSRWFRVTTDVWLGAGRIRLVSDLEREPKGSRVRLLQRRFLAPDQSENS